LIDFLTFKTFITPKVLIVFYYLGAVILPIIVYKFRNNIFAKFGIKKPILNRNLKIFLFLIFVFAELIWRMMFEFMVGYFDIHNALLLIQNSGLRSF